MALEHERRFIVESCSVPRGIPVQEIEQAYMDTQPFHTLRVRIVDGKEFKLTRKYGLGQTREEEEEPITERVAQMMMRSCPFRLQKKRVRVQKNRARQHGTVVDRYSGPLEGLIVVEAEFDDPTTPLFLYDIVENPVEVTDTISNYILARTAHLLDGISPKPNLYQVFSQARKPIVVTGGPGSGKSTALASLHKEQGQILHIIPEAATIIFQQLGVRYPSNESWRVRQFQQEVYSIQQSFETLASIETAISGKKGVIVDRGSLDNAAYLPGGVAELEHVCNTEHALELERYGAVLYLAPPPRDVYERHLSTNVSRRENYEEAVAVSAKTRDAWASHPHFYEIDGTDWSQKMHNFRHVLGKLID